MVDVLLSALLAALTIAMAYLGVHVTLHPPNESENQRLWYKVGFCTCGFLAVVLVVVQGIRTLRAQRSSASQMQALQSDVRETRAEAARLVSEEKLEAARREQAEKDLMLSVGAASKATRQGVAEDIRKSPLHVNVSGQSLEEVARRKTIRDELGGLLEENYQLKSRCTSPPQPNAPAWSCYDATSAWLAKAYGYISNTMESSYKARFLAATGLSLSYNGITDQATQNAVNTLTHKAAALTEFIKEQE